MVEIMRGSGNVWADLGRPNAPAMKLKAELLSALDSHARRESWTEAEAAQRFGLTAVRSGDLLGGEFTKFQLDELVTIAARVGLGVKLIPTTGTKRRQ